ncbi:hypothetical protein H0H81_012149 [Sphagnurus paluster]|uniref:Uncharacterized protein n=1 Tax=Sphagnurus paluster TaxID=117069 RepID=A0A9P7G0H1_9AGAR|nr:hypothetical protein H0H81_012149 [Sphagnurus paluster]
MLFFVDPSHYILHFQTLLESSEETHKVATDWCSDSTGTGCPAAGALQEYAVSARMNTLRRSVGEILQVVNIAEAPLKKRPDQSTPSRSLTFANACLKEEINTLAFTKGKVLGRRASHDATLGVTAGLEISANVEGKWKKGSKKKTKRVEDTEEAEDETVDEVETSLPPPVETSLFNQGIRRHRSIQRYRSSLTPIWT